MYRCDVQFKYKDLIYCRECVNIDSCLINLRLLRWVLQTQATSNHQNSRKNWYFPTTVQNLQEKIPKNLFEDVDQIDPCVRTKG